MKKLYNMQEFHTDYLNMLVKIMTFVEEHDEMITEEQISKKFKKNGFVLFSRYCVGGKIPYAMNYNIGNGVNGYKLTQDGIRKLVDLKRILSNDNQAFWMKIAAISVAIFTVLQYLYTVHGIV